MARILIVKNSHFSNAKLQKYSRLLTARGYELHFLGWQRDSVEAETSQYFTDVRFLLRGGGEATRFLPFWYLFWMLKLFLFAVRPKNTGRYNHLLVTNFESGLPFYVASFINRQIEYIYEIRDDFALSYPFPTALRRLITWLDYKIKRRSLKVIHVDDNRVRELDQNFVIIHNTPIDLYAKYRTPKYRPQLAVVGQLAKNRGLIQIVEFAERHPNFQFLMAGYEAFHDDELRRRLHRLSNCEHRPQMDQIDLFRWIRTCSGVFSLYDPALEINVRAASNKLYDAMMLGIPVIVNKEILAARDVQQHQLGFLVNYHYDETWEELALKLGDTDLVARLGANGRRRYEEHFDFEKIVDDRLIPLFRSRTKPTSAGTDK